MSNFEGPSASAYLRVKDASSTVVMSFIMKCIVS